MSSVFAPVNPALLRWARIESGLQPETVAKRLRFTDASKLEAWEGGKAKPTLRQAEQLANIYKRSLGLFFLPQPPVVSPLAAEYRRLPGVKPGQEPPELRLALRRLQRSREVALDLLEENGESIRSFGLRARSSEPPEDVASRLRHALEVTVEEQKAFGSEYAAWRTWRDPTEGLGTLVFQISGVPLEQARGVSILSDPLPVIGINSKEAPDSRPFTLFHELGRVHN
jgi:transcriptional regulator with XRE-family HTH domain